MAKTSPSAARLVEKNAAEDRRAEKPCEEAVCGEGEGKGGEEKGGSRQLTISGVKGGVHEPTSFGLTVDEGSWAGFQPRGELRAWRLTTLPRGPVQSKLTNICSFPPGPGDLGVTRSEGLARCTGRTVQGTSARVQCLQCCASGYSRYLTYCLGSACDANRQSAVDGEKADHH